MSKLLTPNNDFVRFALPISLKNELIKKSKKLGMSLTDMMIDVCKQFTDGKNAKLNRRYDNQFKIITRSPETLAKALMQFRIFGRNDRCGEAGCPAAKLCEQAVNRCENNLWCNTVLERWLTRPIVNKKTK